MDVKTFVFFLGGFNLLIVSVQTQNRVVQTSLGAIRGRIATHDEGLVQQFLGIRYAKPPVGTLRFEKPVSIDSWQGELDGTQFGPSCPQIFPYNTLAKLPNRNISEDCLMLNIYRPLNNNNGKRAVMVYIHGGGFNSGQGMATDGSLLALKGDVIIITINYRLDVLGFLYTGDDEARGNYGLWDQLKALQWIKDHVSSFGGDENNITLFGVSAGAFSIGLHLFSTHSIGLFQRAILQSGSPFTPLAFAFDPINYAKNVSMELGCSTDINNWDTKEVIECLKAIDYGVILEASVKARTPNRIAYRLEIAPVVDDDFITDLPENIIEKGNKNIAFYTTDVIIGTNSAEGGNVLYMLTNFNANIKSNIRESVPASVLCNNVSKYLVQDFYDSDKDVEDKICTMYNGSTEISKDEQSMKVVDMVGDMMFVTPAVKTLQLHNEHAKNFSTYQYLFSHQPNMNSLKIYFPWFKGANHLDEIPFVFGPKISYNAASRQNIGDEEYQISEEMMIYWTTFAKTGNPNDDGVRSRWPPFTTEQREFINISEKIIIDENLWPLRMRFWNLLPRSRNIQKQDVFSDNSSDVVLVTQITVYIILIIHVFLCVFLIE